ncbi:MAG TPA: glycosyltransferase family 4 protein [Thermoanaerobaculia bacterium]|nr:glycosyltransferase family 4 protein [Thermoanaerobaculia bacterium]
MKTKRAKPFFNFQFSIFNSPQAMKLLFLVNHAGYFLSHRLPVALAANEAGYEVHVATPRSKHVSRIEQAGLIWHPVRLTRSGLNPVAQLLSLFDIYRLYRRVRPDLVHQVTSKPVIYGTFCARLAGVPAVVNALAGLGHLYLAEDFIHRMLLRVVRIAYRITLRHPNMRTIFQNEDDRSLFVSRGLARADQTTIVAGSGVDTKAFAPRQPANPRPLLIMLPGRMLATKGIFEFVAAAKALKVRYPDVRFVLVGEPDPDNPASVTERDLDAWCSEGVVECWGRRSEMQVVYAGADVICLPSYREGMPKVLLEAGAMGLPVVTTDVPGCRDVVVDGLNGFVVPVRDSGVELAKALERLIVSDELRRDLGAAGRKRVLDLYSLEHVIEATLAVYRELLP